MEYTKSVQKALGTTGASVVIPITAPQGADEGRVLDVHVTPSGDVAAWVEDAQIAKNIDPFHATSVHVSLAGKV